MTPEQERHLAVVRTPPPEPPDEPWRHVEFKQPPTEDIE